MLIQPTLDALNALKLHGMAAALSEQMTQSAAQGLSCEERIGLLVEREAVFRENRRLTRLLQQAQLKERACLEDLDFRSNATRSRNPMSKTRHDHAPQFKAKVALEALAGEKR